MLKLYLYGYLNRIASSRRLERECQRNVELMWLTGRLAPDFKTIADFRRDNSAGIRNVCRRFVMLCRDLKLFSQAAVAIDGSKFKAVNSRDCNFTETKIDINPTGLHETPGRFTHAEWLLPYKLYRKTHVIQLYQSCQAVLQICSGDGSVGIQGIVRIVEARTGEKRMDRIKCHPRHEPTSC